MDYGTKLLEVLKRQKEQSFIRLANGEKMITNHLIYNQCEEESFRLQNLIGLQNKREMAKQLGCKTNQVLRKIKELQDAYHKLKYA